METEGLSKRKSFGFEHGIAVFFFKIFWGKQNKNKSKESKYSTEKIYDLKGKETEIS